jgi:predicted branched-subunit amino acid permease
MSALLAPSAAATPAVRPTADRRAAAPARRRTARPEAVAARSDLLAMLPSMLPFGLARGVTITSVRSLGDAAGAISGGLVYAGTAQLSAITMLERGVGVLAVVLSAAVVNSRLLLYGAALEPGFRHQPLWFRLVGVHLVVDATYVAAVGRPELLARPDAFRSYWTRLGFWMLGLWSSSVALGVLLGPLLPSLPHLGLLGLSLFIALLLLRLRTSPALASAAAAAAVAPAVGLLVPSLAIGAGAVAGVVAGMLAAARSS